MYRALYCLLLNTTLLLRTAASLNLNTASLPLTTTLVAILLKPNLSTVNLLRMVVLPEQLLALVPLNLVLLHAPCQSVSTSSAILNTNSELILSISDAVRARAMWDFAAQDASELSFRKGDVINILERNGEWWKGELNGAVGVLPANYVQLM